MMQQYLLKRLYGRTLLASFAVVFCAICGLVYIQAQSPDIGSPTATNNGGSIALQPPAFLQTVYAQETYNGFDDAGLIAYVNVGESIDFDLMRDNLSLAVIPENGSIAWDMSPPGYDGDLEAFDEYTDVKMFVHQDGWVFAYLASNRNASLLIDWIAYQDQQGLSSTTLAKTIDYVLRSIGKTINTLPVSYYHHRYQDATDLMLIADGETYDRDTDTFDVKVPIDFKLYEASWAHAAYSITSSTCSFNDIQLSEHGFCSDCWQFSQAKLTSENELKLKNADEFQRFSIYHNGYVDDGTPGQFSACGLALIYKRSE